MKFLMKYKKLFLTLAYFINVMALLWNSFAVSFWIKYRGGKGMWETIDKSGCLFWLILSIVNLTVITVFLIICKRRKNARKTKQEPRLEKSIDKTAKKV